MSNPTRSTLLETLIESRQERRTPPFATFLIAIVVHCMALGAVMAKSWLEVPPLEVPPLEVPPIEVPPKPCCPPPPSPTPIQGQISAGGSSSLSEGDGERVLPRIDKAPVREVARIQSHEPPEVLYEVEPEYPRLAMMSGVEGTVILKVVILRDGTVGEITVLRGLPMGLTEAAVDAVKRRRYRHATSRRGEPAKIETTMTIHFRI